ncbi:MAG: ribbon-helix-helix protein, CopG family [Bryobacterales bacterium]|nr:ribbon-helix-helix protein, CopG family [Bryobacterales bacterium]
MKAATREKRVENSPPAVRTSISFPREAYQTLELIAKEKKVSMAWVVREAVDQYIDSKWPLLANRNYDRS